MLGAIAGDIIGSVHEHAGTKTPEFELFHPDCRFTDDSVLAIAVADCLLHGFDYVERFHEYVHAYPKAGYGFGFFQWAMNRSRKPYNSWGNGSAMRVPAIGWVCEPLDEVCAEAKRSAEVTHDHPEGIRGAQATAAAVYLGRTGKAKSEIRKTVESMFGYDLHCRLDDMRPSYEFDVSCQGTVPHAIIAFLDSNGYEDAVRKAISLGGDADTLACIAGGIAEAFYGRTPAHIATRAFDLLDERLRETAGRFCARYGIVTPDGMGLSAADAEAVT
jgi:ADP-ribosylglycohydrolase